MKEGVLKSLVALSLLSASVGASAAVLNISSSGILLGASGVDVGGTLYDVTFADGLVGNSSILFNTFDSAQLASTALMNQVFLDGALGSFNSQPTKTQGCESASSSCIVNTAHEKNASEVSFSRFVNQYPRSDFVPNGSARLGSSLNTSVLLSQTLATWQLSPTTAVPEPETYAMFMAGLGLMGFVARRRKA